MSLLASLGNSDTDLFRRLDVVYEDLERLNRAHNRTPYGCGSTGNCCQVGLQPHMMECVAVARHLEAGFADRPGARDKLITRLQEALTDSVWTSGEGVGSLMCALWDDGCTVHPARPAVCRMYGVILELNDECPRRRLANGSDFIYVSPDVDKLVREFYATLDAWGKRHPRLDFSVYFASGLLRALLPEDEWRAIRDRSPDRFWRTIPGYRSQFKPSGRRPATERTPEAARHPALRFVQRP